MNGAKLRSDRGNATATFVSVAIPAPGSIRRVRLSFIDHWGQARIPHAFIFKSVYRPHRETRRGESRRERHSE